MPATLGDIYRMQQSIKDPIRHILQRFLRESQGIASASLTDSRSRNALPPSFSSLTSGAREGKNRPCIVDILPTRSTKDMYIYVMATYDDDPLPNMPQVYQHFSLAIAPNNSGNHLHLHADPEWAGKPNQWVIACRYPVSEQVYTGASRWLNAWRPQPEISRRAKRSHHRLGKTMLRTLDIASDFQMDAWLRRCNTDPTLVEGMIKACQKSSGSRKARSGNSRASESMHTSQQYQTQSPRGASLASHRNSCRPSLSGTLPSISEVQLENHTTEATNAEARNSSGWFTASYGKRMHSRRSSLASVSYNTGRGAA